MNELNTEEYVQDKDVAWTMALQEYGSQVQLEKKPTLNSSEEFHDVAKQRYEERDEADEIARKARNHYISMHGLGSLPLAGNDADLVRRGHIVPHWARQD